MMLRVQCDYLCRYSCYYTTHTRHTHTYQHTTTIPLLSIAPLYTAVDSHARGKTAHAASIVSSSTELLLILSILGILLSILCILGSFAFCFGKAGSSASVFRDNFRTIFRVFPLRGGPTFFNSDQVGPQQYPCPKDRHQSSET